MYFFPDNYADIERDNKILKALRKEAIVDAAYTEADSCKAKLARLICPKLSGKAKENWLKQVENWFRRGSKTHYWIVLAIFKLTQVSPYRLGPLETPALDEYFELQPFVKVFSLNIDDIKLPDFFDVPETKGDLDRPVILDVRNNLILGKETLDLARKEKHETVKVIRIDIKALLICQRNLLTHPKAWFGVEIRAIASYIEVFAKEYRIIHADTSQDLRSYSYQRLGLKEGSILIGSKENSTPSARPNIVSGSWAGFFTKPTSEPGESKSQASKTINNDKSEDTSDKFKP